MIISVKEVLGYPRCPMYAKGRLEVLSDKGVFHYEVIRDAEVPVEDKMWLAVHFLSWGEQKALNMEFAELAATVFEGWAFFGKQETEYEATKRMIQRMFIRCKKIIDKVKKLNSEGRPLYWAIRPDMQDLSELVSIIDDTVRLKSYESDDFNAEAYWLTPVHQMYETLEWAVYGTCGYDTQKSTVKLLGIFGYMDREIRKTISWIIADNIKKAEGKREDDIGKSLTENVEKITDGKEKPTTI